MSYRSHSKKVRQLAKELDGLLKEWEAADAEYRKRLDAWPEDRSVFPDSPSPALTGEIRRRSMDLTRALAQLRKP